MGDVTRPNSSAAPMENALAELLVQPQETVIWPHPLIVGPQHPLVQQETDAATLDLFATM